MSFITKRERVFNEYDLYELPARNEGKLKAYSSCTDARAWSHFCTDKSEHLVEIIKRNNDVCRKKYVPTEAIVDTLMVGKNTEIARLNRKIDEFEQMLAAYDELDLDCEQKCEIAKLHADIRAANKDLDLFNFNLDLSCFTEGSDAFETGKSRGDEPSVFQDEIIDDETPKSKGDEWTFEKDTSDKDNKSVQAEQLSCPCDASTYAVDPRIQEMEDIIIGKDAKLNAMQNTIAVMENDVCEPYCIYAHIYTALEKIFGILCQNNKYKLYLDLMTSGKDTRCIDIKGKILFKLKVLEKFSMALIAPCSQDFSASSNQDCSCYRAEIIPRIETAFALTSAESKPPCLDNKRAQLVADIMENDEMKEILSKENISLKNELEIDDFKVETYNIDSENLKRLINLQENYDDLMTCYEALKHEKKCLQDRCHKYEELERDFEDLRSKLREYNGLWNEKEYYQRRSADLDALKQQYLVLSDETSNLEVQLQAESEINKAKNRTIEDLRQENLLLQQKLDEALVSFEKDKNYLQCKLKESDCKTLCQDQQIKSLSIQVDRLLEHDPDQVQGKETEAASIARLDEINALNEQITNLKEVCLCDNDEKRQMQVELETNLDIINDLKMQIEHWKSVYEKTIQRNSYLEKYTDDCSDEIQRLKDNNRRLTDDVDEKAAGLENLIEVIDHKSQEVDRLMKTLEKRHSENADLHREIQSIRETYSNSFAVLDHEKTLAIKSLELAKQESKELFEKVKDYDDIVHKQNDLTTSFQTQNEEYQNLKSMIIKAKEENKNLQMDINSRDSNRSILLQEIQKLHERQQLSDTKISNLYEEKITHKLSAELSKKESEVLREKLLKFEQLSEQLHKLKGSHDKLLSDKMRLEIELQEKKTELDDALHFVQLKRQESEELVNKLNDSEHLKTDLLQSIINDKQTLQNKLSCKKNEFDKLLKLFNDLQFQNEQSSEEIESLKRELAATKRAFDNISTEKKSLQSDFENKNDEINNLCNNLESKIEENRELFQRLTISEHNQKVVSSNVSSLLNENISTKSNLAALKKESDELMKRLIYYETLESEYDKLKNDNDKMREEKDKLKRELDIQKNDIGRIERENRDLSSQSKDLLSHSEDLEKALINARTELIVKSSFTDNSHAEIMKEIEQMRQEKLNQQKRIRDLLDTLDASENAMSNLREDIVARDDRISILENHINELEDEVRKLHNSLAEVVITGEQITESSSQQINQSRLSIEAHHSRATHNMKMELAKLQSENTMLEERLSATKMRNEETTRDKNNYLSQISHLQNEKEIIVTDIKQLEMSSVGDSALCPQMCEVEDILASLDRIRKYLNARSSKSTSLEQTLLSVQNSYQLVQAKTDEAKKIVEKEKQKTVSEKEEAIKDKISMEKQLVDLKKQLEQQVLHDKNIIKDLEAEILNQKLIIDKVNQSTQSYITKLKEEMKSLELLYANAFKEINTLESKLKTLSLEKSQQFEIIESTSKDLAQKIEEVRLLHKALNELKKDPGESISIQTSVPTNSNESQTENKIKYEEPTYKNDQEKIDNLLINNDISPVLVNKATHNQNISQDSKKKEFVNEVQILAASVDPSFDFIKSSYLSYKVKQLGPGRLEHCSISCEDTDINNEESLSPNEGSTSKGQQKSESSSKSKSKDINKKVIDIYNTKSMQTNSSKVMDNFNIENEADVNMDANQVKSPAKSSAYTAILGNNSFGYNDNSNNKYKDSSIYRSTSEESTDKDLFVIYKDSESNPEKSYEKQGPWNGKGHSEIVVESVTVHQNKYDQKHNMNQRSPSNEIRKQEIEYDSLINQEHEDYDEDDSVKQKLKISLPRVENDNTSLEASDAEKKSLDSYTITSYPSQKIYYSSVYNPDNHVRHENDKLMMPSTILTSDNNHKTKYLNTTSKEQAPKPKIAKEITKSDKNKAYPKFNNTTDSHHQLARVGADVLLIKPIDDRNKPTQGPNSIRKKKTEDFGLTYIQDSNDDPDSFKTYNAAKALRKTRSDDRFNLADYPESDVSPTRSSEFKKSSADYKTILGNSFSRSTDKIQTKSYIEQSIMAKLDLSNTVEEYKNKIEQLTRTLENIERDYKKKIDAIKLQCDNHIKGILKEHNQGVESIQNLHEDTLKDILQIHENEVENWRTMSIEAMRKADKLEKENKSLKTILDSSSGLDEEPIKISTPDVKHRIRTNPDPKLLTKTHVEAFTVKPKKPHGPCTCSLDINVSDTIRNIFEQVDVEQRKMAEYNYLKYISSKMMNGSVDDLDTQELSFLHLKVCRIWKSKLNKEETLQKRIDSLEAELLSKQKNTQQNIAKLDRKVAEERRRLQEISEAVCRSATVDQGYPPPAPPPTAKNDVFNYSGVVNRGTVGQRASDEELVAIPGGLRQKRTRNESNRAVLAKMDIEEQRREKKIYMDELPTRLRKSHDRALRGKK